MNTIFVHRDGRTEQVTSIDRSWLSPAANVYIWVDLAAPSIPESLVLTETFAFHWLSVDDALQHVQLPKIEAYDGYLFAAVAGGDADLACFMGAHYLVSVHWHDAKAVSDLVDSIRHGGQGLADGPLPAFHTLLAGTIGSLAPVLGTITHHVTALERRLLEKPNADLVAEVLNARGDAFALLRRLQHEREALDRLVRREVVDISIEMTYRFRDARDKLAALADGALALEHRLAGVLTAAAAAAGSRRWF